MVLVAVVQGVGVLHARGEHTQQVYAIPPQGVLVHPYDVEGIVAQQRTFCCRDGEAARVIHPFFEGKATSGQVAFVEVPDPDAPPGETTPAERAAPAEAPAEGSATVKGRKHQPNIAPIPARPVEVDWPEGEPSGVEAPGGVETP